MELFDKQLCSIKKKTIPIVYGIHVDQNYGTVI